MESKKQITDKVDGLVGIMVDLKRQAQEVANQYHTIYGDNRDMEDHERFVHAQCAIYDAIEKVGFCIASVVVQPE